MKRFPLFTIPLLYNILVMNPPVHAGTNVWTSIGPDGGTVQAIAVDPQNPATLYAVAAGAIFKTTDGAANWTRVYLGATYDGAASPGATLVAVHPYDSNTLYAGTVNGLYKSTDGGATWSTANNGLPKPFSIPNVFTGAMSVGVLAIDPWDPETIYAGVSLYPPISPTTTPTLFKSTDGGTSWFPVSSGLIVDQVNPDNTHLVVYRSVYSVAIDPQDPNTLYVAANGPTPGGVFKSTDGGANWSRSSDGLAVVALAIDPRQPSTLYAAGDGVFKSTDGGGSWRAASSGLPEFILSLAIDPQNPDILYASPASCGLPPCKYAQVFKSTDGGTSWTGTGLAFALSARLSTAALAIDPTNPKTVYAGTYSGVMKSPDAGANWNTVDSGLTASKIDSLTIDLQNAGGFFAISQGSVLRTADGGVHWSKIYTPLPSDDGKATYPASMLVADPGALGTYYIGIDDNSDGGGGVLKSTDGGASWKRMPLPSRGGLRELVMDPQNPSALYAMVPRHGVYKSTDGAASWSEIAGVNLLKPDPFFGPTLAFCSILIDPLNPSTLYLGLCNSGGGLLKSTDGGQTWSSLMIPFSNSAIALALDPQNPGTIYVSETDPSSYSDLVVKTADGGQNWKTLSSGLPVFQVTGPYAYVLSIAVNPQNSNIVFAATSGLGVFWSTNGGLSWSPLNTGLTNLNVQTVLIHPRNPDTVYAGTRDGGVFAITRSMVGN